MNPHHLLLLGMAFFLMDILLDDAEANPTISSIGSIESFASQLDEIDLTLLNRALRQQGNDCDSQEEVREVCQRCAKVTRSTAAYPLCCQQRETLRHWCVRFLAFGISK